MTNVLLSVKRQLGCPIGEERVGLPHGAEGGFDPHSAYQDLTDDNYYSYLLGRILPPTAPSEWVRRCVLTALSRPLVPHCRFC